MLISRKKDRRRKSTEAVFIEVRWEKKTQKNSKRLLKHNAIWVSYFYHGLYILMFYFVSPIYELPLKLFLFVSRFSLNWILVYVVILPLREIFISWKCSNCCIVQGKIWGLFKALRPYMTFAHQQMKL